MNHPTSVYTPGVIATIEQFTLLDESLRQFVVYTYYNENEEPIYIGCSKSFYNTHYFNSERFDFEEEIKYVGFFFFDNEDDMKDARKYFIRAREPKYNQRKCKEVDLLPELEPSADHLVVLREEMEDRWFEWLEPEELTEERIEELEELEEDREIKNLVNTLKKTGREYGCSTICEEAASVILDLYDRLRAIKVIEETVSSELDELKATIACNNNN